MATQIILKKEQLVKPSYSGSINESKIIGFPKEESPVKPYSSIFYWSQLTSDFGSVIAEHPIIGFEILTYVIQGTYNSFDKISDEWTKLKQGDIQIIQAGKGIRYSGKLLPMTQILQIWLDPDFNIQKKTNPALSKYSSDAITYNPTIENNRQEFKFRKSLIRLTSKNVSVQVLELLAGYHNIPCPKDSVLSGYMLDGFAELNETLIGAGDYFKFDGKNFMKLASLTNTKIFLLSSPLKPEYVTYSELVS